MVYRVGGKASSNDGSPAFWPMLVRRMATVTISAPLASTARRVPSKSRYFPVAISRGSAICSAKRVGAFIALAAADSDDDFERVAFGEPRVRIAAPRHDLSVFFHRHALAGELERLQQSRDVRAGLDRPNFTVDGEPDHLETPRTRG